MKKLTQTDVRKLPDGSHNFGDGLMLRVGGNCRSWFLRVQIDGKRYQRGLGSALAITLGQARVEAAKMKAEMLAGNVKSRRQIAAEKRNEKTIPTFEDIWEAAIDARQNVQRWKNSKHADQWRNTIRNYALPVLGKLDVSGITRHDILRVLVPIWDTKTETANRLRGRLETIFDYCIREGFREKENPARWKGQLEFDLPSRQKVAKVKHFEAPTVEELQAVAPHFLKTNSGRCILFGVLTACRAHEFVAAQWSEIDFDAGIFSVPPERRKDSKPFPHRVPLSKQAVKILKLIEKDGTFIFKGMNGKPHLSIQTPRLILIKNIKRNVTMHGCRSTFRDWCAEQGVDQVIAEKCLMHNSESKVVQAYQRSDLLEQRRPVMQKWADFVCAKCEALRGSSTP